MGRNDLCFCISGKKTKKCHPDIDENSLEAAKLKIYGKLNEHLNNHRLNVSDETLCVPGCSDCCYDYYTLQGVEFDLILRELKKWDKEKLDDLINKVNKYWKVLGEDHPQVSKLLTSTAPSEIDDINQSIDKTSFPCVFLDEASHLCQLYDVRPFKCRIFGNSYYYPSEDEGAIGIACEKYGPVINEDNFDFLLSDVTEILNENTDLAVIHDKSRNTSVVNPEYPLIYHLYQHFVVEK